MRWSTAPARWWDNKLPQQVSYFAMPFLLVSCATRLPASPPVAVEHPGPATLALAWHDDRPEGAVFDSKVVSWSPGWKEMHMSADEGQIAGSTDRFTGVLCTITIEGESKGCRILFVDGSPMFSRALLAWLQHPGLRFHPMTLGDQPVVGRHIFYIGLKARATNWGGSHLRAYPEGVPPHAAPAVVN